jgi:threonine dehydrogenase-like Zn-dependent dehydrogenase
VLGIIGRDGAHAEFLTLPAENLFEVPDNVCDTAAVFTEPLAASLGITEQVDIAPETKVAIIGDGKLGLLCALSLSRSSRKVRVIGRHRNKLDIAEKAGVSVMMEADARDLNGNFDVVVEASGSGSGFASAVELVRPRGKIVLKSTFHGTPSWPASRIVVDEITVIGSRCGRFAPALELLADGSFDLALMVTDEFNLSEGIAAFRRAEEPGVLKVLLRMQ